MNSNTLRPLSESDEKMLEAYLRLTPENRQKVISYLAILKASQCTPEPSADSRR